MSYFRKTYRFNFSHGITPAVKYLLISNIVIFLLTRLMGQEIITWVNDWFALSTFSVTNELQIWRFITYMFVHNDFWHVFFNMFMLWMFGCDVESYLGTTKFIKYYVMAGLSGGLLHILFFSSQVIGASGAVYGVMIAFAVLFRERIITLLLFFVFPIQLKAKYLIVILFGTSLLFFALWGAESRIAHFAHLGGALFGLIYLYFFGKLVTISAFFKNKKNRRAELTLIRHKQNLNNIREEIDIILDKINEVGYDNLTRDEKKILTEYSKKLPEQEDHSKN